ncbi:cytochrome c biogenesis protein DipZ [Variovorax sp. J22G73]|uniref:cytochrome c biogenesis protein DipZ n=1 Tax=unclassified Variovorax TaxID=663243 RepID=UPI002577822F|nr:MULTISPECIES: cytochrome c biogenesis protein DipZ [unclassified Variovorax]MDM0008241.1 cytochrome c biogenesis protein DipZ [Variovorax sp. J22R203]MDM0100747.1 cytochrome c biogenesis protein DipZ [Variovorax sp. J22G73]
MLLFVVAYLGGVLTILSPCILPVLPFVFARGDQPFLKSGLPLLLGMALTFAGVASLAAVGGGWAVQANQYGRLAAIVMMALFGITLLFPQLAERLTRPLVGWGERLSASAEGDGSQRRRSAFVTSLLLGVATGLLWAPCAGPILGLVLTGAALGGASAQTSLLLLAYAAGAATSLAGALLIGGRVFKVMKKSLGAGEWIRRGIGVALLCGVAAIALGLDTGVLAQLSLAGTSSVEQALIDKVRPKKPLGQPTEEPAVVTTGPDSTVMMAGSNAMMAPGNAMMAASNSMMMSADKGAGTASPSALPVEGNGPSLDGAVQWLNSPPLTMEGLSGKVVLVDFWTYSCINCLRALPYVQAWAEKYKDKGLVVIGVHAPEFAFEKDIGNVRKAVKDLKLGYPVAVDNDYAIWRAFKNEYWPAHYFIDAQGRIRHHHFGEGEYDKSEQVIQQLLAEAGQGAMPGDLVKVEAQGAQAAADSQNVKSPETYIGYERAENFASAGGFVQGKPHAYAVPAELKTNQWALGGDWTVAGQDAVLGKARGRIAYRFHARDLHLVLGSGDGRPVRIKVTIDGKPPGEDHGMDIDAQGLGTVSGQRLYQLVRQRGTVADRRFEIEFLDPGAQAYAFTFG